MCIRIADFNFQNRSSSEFSKSSTETRNFWPSNQGNNDSSILNLLHAYMQEICSFFAEIFNDLNKDLISKYFLVVFTLSFIHSFRVEHDYLVNPTKL